ncbi:MAG: FlgD immunoglobulin-like domain containing protein [Candidatus Cloacimonetes bacterium]|nr:FlgD immunoglobulin-like domain containing protein [Candidatus Cloacimonadota bacterium]
MKKIFSGILLASLLLSRLLCQNSNVLIVGSATVNENENFELSLLVNNDSDFVAVQLDLLLPETVFYIENFSSLTERAQDHVLSVSTNNNTLRIIIFSMTMSAFLGNNGSIANLAFSQILESGEYEIIAENVILADDNSQNILTDVENGTLVILPEVGVVDPEINNETMKISVFPNPFNPSANIVIELPENASISVEIFNIKGKLQRRITSSFLSKGNHQFIWNGKNDAGYSIASGNYLCRINVNGSIQTKKMILLK